MSETLLIYVPVPHFRGADGILFEAQAINGLRLWAQNFDRVLVMSPLAPGPAPAGWDALPDLARVELHSLPMAYRPDRFLRAWPGTARCIRGLIERADYLSFAIGGLFGDWGAVAARQAQRMGRPYAVWTDRVESEVTRQAIRSGPFRSRVRAALTYRPMARLERAVIRRAALGLFHGAETYQTYAPHCRNPQIVHDIHISRSDHIGPEARAVKIAGAAGGPLRIAYAGRADPMKGPLDWVAALRRLDADGLDFTATWLGDGSQMPALRQAVDDAGLADRVSLPGFTADRQALLATLRHAHLFAFCHKTPESPRNLIEALVSATPIVGYDGAFARDLVAAHGGGWFVPRGDSVALARALAALARDRTALADLIGRAAKDGAPFDDVGVFRHRSALIKTHLTTRRRASARPDPDPEHREPAPTEVPRRIRDG